MKLILIAILVLLIFSGCSIPVVGNSPEEIKHRKQLEDEP